MRTNLIRHALAGALGALGALGGMASCHRAGNQLPATSAVTLLVRNNAFLDVVVYALPSVGIDTRIRLETVTGHSSARLDVPRHALRPGGTLVVYLHAIGSARSWVSPSLQVDADSDICLDIQSSPDGDLSRTSLYLVPRTVTASRPSASPEPAASRATEGGAAGALGERLACAP